MLCMGVLPACMSMHMYVYVCTYVQCTQRPEEGARFLGTTVKEGCDPPRECREFNLGPPEKQPVLLTLSHSSSPVCF